MFFALKKKGCWIFFVRHLFTHSSWKSFSQFFTTHSGYLSCKAFSLTTAVHLLSVALSWPTDQNQIQLLNQLWLGVKGFQCSSGLLCLCSQSKIVKCDFSFVLGRADLDLLAEMCLLFQNTYCAPGAFLHVILYVVVPLRAGGCSYMPHAHKVTESEYNRNVSSEDFFHLMSLGDSCVEQHGNFLRDKHVSFQLHHKLI